MPSEWHVVDYYRFLLEFEIQFCIQIDNKKTSIIKWWEEEEKNGR